MVAQRIFGALKAQAHGVDPQKTGMTFLPTPGIPFSFLYTPGDYAYSAPRKSRQKRQKREAQDEPWSLIDELTQNRNTYKVPDDKGVPLKLCFPYQEQISRLCQRVGVGHNGKDPGYQPAGFAMIKYALPLIEQWPEAKELAESVSRRLALPDDVDKGISREICRYAKGVKLLPAPPETTGIHNVVLDKETGSRLKTNAKKMEIPYHPLASLCVLVALLAQSVGVNLEEKEEISRLVKEIRQRIHTAGWCAGALMDKLQAERARV